MILHFKNCAKIYLIVVRRINPFYAKVYFSSSQNFFCWLKCELLRFEISKNRHEYYLIV